MLPPCLSRFASAFCLQGGAPLLYSPHERCVTQKRPVAFRRASFYFLSVWHMKASCFATIESSNHATTKSELTFAYLLFCFVLSVGKGTHFLHVRQMFCHIFSKLPCIFLFYAKLVHKLLKIRSVFR